MSSGVVTPLEILQRMEVPGLRDVFTLGNFARQVTFASQQTRAFNLIWALFEERRLAADQRVAVVGAGLAGLTATVAALARRCRVDLYEQASQPFPLQRGNDIRFIHPNILRWPEENSDYAHTDLPLLNWTAANVRSVIRQIEIQWRRYARSERLCSFFNYKVTRLHAAKGDLDYVRPWLVANRVVDGSAPGEGVAGRGGTENRASGGTGRGFVERAYDAVILAIGFGEERPVEGVPFISYWENDSLHQEVGTRGRRSILVSGCGDGGLIDALRLRLRNFDHSEFVRLFQSAGDSASMIDELLRIERELRPHARSADISVRFQAAYDAVRVPSAVRDYYQDVRRADTTVTLNSPEAGPLSYKASLLNRYATYLALQHADLRYLSGRIVTERAAPGRYDVILEQPGSGMRETKSFDLVVVRHGPKSVIDDLVPASALAELRAAWADTEDVTTRPCWQGADPAKPHQFFVEALIEEPTPPEDEIGLARVAFDSAFDAYSRKDLVESVAISKRTERPGFVVTLKDGAQPPPPERYAGVSVYFVAAPPALAPAGPGLPAAPAPVTADAQALAVGIGIYNYDARLRAQASSAARAAAPREGDPAAAESPASPLSASLAGTLGCFAADDAGQVYLISTAHVLSPLNGGQIGDRIFREGESQTAGHTHVARLSKLLPVNQEGGLAAFDIAAAKLEDAIRPDYGPFVGAGIKLTIAGSASRGEAVQKLTRRSGLTSGVVKAVDVSLRVMTSASATGVFANCIEIAGDRDQPFMATGDSGAIAVRKDGVAVGLLFASNPPAHGRQRTALASSLDKALSALMLTLLPTPATGRPSTAVSRSRAQTTKRRRSRKSS